MMKVLVPRETIDQPWCTASTQRANGEDPLSMMDKSNFFSKCGWPALSRGNRRAPETLDLYEPTSIR